MMDLNLVDLCLSFCTLLSVSVYANMYMCLLVSLHVLKMTVICVPAVNMSRNEKMFSQE